MKMRHTLCCIASVFTMVLTAGAVVYTPIPGVFSTGVGATGTPLAVGEVDPHYSVTASPFGALDAAKVTRYFMWNPDTASSSWISATGYGAGDPPVGVYVYSLTFSLDGFDPSTASISGEWASDNTSKIYLNGVDTGISHFTPWEFAHFEAFSLTQGFVEGVNTLSFVVDQLSGSGGNPHGLHVRILSATAIVPEPTTFSLLIAGSVLMMASRLRQRKS